MNHSEFKNKLIKSLNERECLICGKNAERSKFRLNKYCDNCDFTINLGNPSFAVRLFGEQDKGNFMVIDYSFNTGIIYFRDDNKSINIDPEDYRFKMMLFNNEKLEKYFLLI